MADLHLTWCADGADWIGGVAELPRVLLLIEPAPWGKCKLRVYSRSKLQHEKVCGEADEAKEAAMAACQLLAIREAV